ncbi:MAG: hypothetical protein IJI14_17000 [Anaerolineaceae bacterium]|nr:hypothetical protein [Anaerolineaceae bacterium]
MQHSYIIVFSNWLVDHYGIALSIAIPIICWFVQAVGKFFVFKKAGKTPWHGFIPVLSDWHQLDLSWNRMIAWLWVGILIICCLFLSGIFSGLMKPYIHDSLTIVFVITLYIIMIIDCYQLAKAFGKNFFFVLGLFFLFPIFMVILGLDNSKYLGPQE